MNVLGFLPGAWGTGMNWASNGAMMLPLLRPASTSPMSDGAPLRMASRLRWYTGRSAAVSSFHGSGLASRSRATTSTSICRAAMPSGELSVTFVCSLSNSSAPLLHWYIHM